jgi:spore germination cell wall hydrolase CwlJ-like protein
MKKRIIKLFTAIGITILLFLTLSYLEINHLKIKRDSLKQILDTPSVSNITGLEVLPIQIGSLEPQALEPSVLYHSTRKINLSQRDRDCILRNIFHEARGEPILGKLAVAQVTFNRLNSGRWGNTICKVVFAKSQFSWTLDKKKRHSKPGGPMWKQTKEVLEMYLAGTRLVELQNSTHFHATWMERKPGWAYKKQELTTIGQHTFYASLR